MKNLTECQAYEALTSCKTQWPILLTPQAIANQVVTHLRLNFSYAGYLLPEPILEILQSLADEQQVIRAYQDLLAGHHMNLSEKRAVTHHQTRGANRGFYGQEQARADTFAQAIRQGTLQSAFGLPFTTVVQVGIGGSELGPKAIYDALQGLEPPQLEAHFLANVDPDEFALLITKLPLPQTLFILVSKSGTTLETTVNLDQISQYLNQIGWTPEQIRGHLVSITMPNTPLDQPKRFRERFIIEASIGGRYSATSVVGTLLLSLAFGPHITTRFLKGAGELDQNALTPNSCQNLSLMAALLGIWECNILGCASRAVIPYSRALTSFPAHLQQLDCESNGKSVNREGMPITYATGPVVFGEPGTNSQHSFFQKLHQGQDLVPIQCIGFSVPQSQSPLSEEAQHGLLTSLVAQLVAFSTGQTHSDPNKVFKGHRPCSLVFAPQLTPETLGALLAFYENKVMFEGFLWNLNSFDQEGVQLGKTLTQEATAQQGPKWPLLEAYLGMLNN